MFPDGDVTIPDEVPGIVGDPLQVGLPGRRERWSVGVGGVTVVRGVSSEEALGGVLGIVFKAGRFRPAVVGRSGVEEVWIGCGSSGGFSIDLDALRELMLPRRSPTPNRAPKPDPFSAGAVEDESGLVFASVPFFGIGSVRASFSFLTGDISLLYSAELDPGRLCETSNVLACCGAKLGFEEEVGGSNELSGGLLGSKTLPSDCAPITGGSLAAVLINGDDEVRYPMCD